MGCNRFNGSPRLMQMNLLSIYIRTVTTRGTFNLNSNQSILLFNYYFAQFTTLFFFQHIQFSFITFNLIFYLVTPSALWSSLGIHCYRAYFPLYCKSLDLYFEIVLKHLPNIISLISCDNTFPLGFNRHKPIEAC